MTCITADVGMIGGHSPHFDRVTGYDSYSHLGEKINAAAK